MQEIPLRVTMRARPLRRSLMLLRAARPLPASLVCACARRTRASSLLACACALVVTACTTLATTPSWVGGGLAEVAPLREAEAEAEEQRERAILAAQPTRIGARHVLVMHEKSKSKPDGVSRTRDEAWKRAHECLIKIRGGADFEAVVKECTDEPGGAERGGDLGVFERSAMVKGFADVAFALKVNEVSEVVETVYGFHIIKRTE